MSDERFFDRLYELRDGDAVRRHHDQFATTYDQELASRGYAQPDRVADSLVAADVPFEARILDAGCGTGLTPIAVVTPYDAELGAHIPGLGSQGWVVTTRRR